MRKIAALLISILLVCPERWPLPAAWAADTATGGGDSAGDVATLDGVDVAADSIKLHLSEPVRYNAFMTANPPRLVVEMLDTQINLSEKSLGGKGTYLKDVRCAQYSGKPNPVARVVLDLRQSAGYRIAAQDNDLVVSLGAADSGTEGAAPAAPPAPQPTAASAAVAAPASTAPPAAKAPPPAAPAAAAKAPRAVKPKASAAPIPASVAAKVRAAAKAPAAKAPAAAETPAPSSVVSAAEVAQAAAPERPSASPEAPETPATKPRRKSADDRFDLNPRTMSPDLGDDVEKIEREAHAANARAKAARAARARVPPPAPAPKAKRDILATLPTDLISLDFDSTDIGDVLKLMGAKANINIVFDPTRVAGPVSLHLLDVPFNEAFNMVLSMKQLVATQAGKNILRVMTLADLTAERQTQIGVTRVFSVNYKKASEMKGEIDAIRAAEKRQGNTVADDTNNVLIVTETPDGISEDERLLSQLDVRPQQVLIETKLVEVKLEKDLEYGIQWDYLGFFPSGRVGGQRAVNAVGSAANPLDAVNNPAPTLGSNGSAIQPMAPLTGGVSNSVGASGRGTGVNLGQGNAAGAFTIGRITNNYFLTATLTAAAAEGKARTLADPKIATINGKLATINLTSNIPYTTSSVTPTGTVSSAVTYVTAGLVLNVTPMVTADGRINLVLAPNFTTPSAISGAGGTTGAPQLDTRSATTNLLVQDGETIVIGGMIQDNVQSTIQKVPLFGDIPLLGWLFKKKTLVRNRTELLIFVTSKIMQD